jgi:hypothetical protein
MTVPFLMGPVYMTVPFLMGPVYMTVPFLMGPVYMTVPFLMGPVFDVPYWHESEIVYLQHLWGRSSAPWSAAGAHRAASAH